MATKREYITSIYDLLDKASVLADQATEGERHSDETFRSLAQSIDFTLARCEAIMAELDPDNAIKLLRDIVRQGHMTHGLLKRAKALVGEAEEG